MKKNILILLFLCIVKGTYAESIEFPWTPNIISNPALTGVNSYSIDWEIAPNWVAGKYAKLKENWVIVNTVYWENNSNIRYWNFYFENMPNGDYSYAVQLCNGSGSVEKCTEGNKVLIKISNSYDKEKVIFIRDTNTNKSLEKKQEEPKTIKEPTVKKSISIPPRSDKTFVNYEDNLKAKINLLIKMKKIDNEKITIILWNIETLKKSLEIRNRKWLLTWSEKKNYFILKMIKWIFESYKIKSSSN